MVEMRLVAILVGLACVLVLVVGATALVGTDLLDSGREAVAGAGSEPLPDDTLGPRDERTDVAPPPRVSRTAVPGLTFPWDEPDLDDVELIETGGAEPEPEPPHPNAGALHDGEVLEAWYEDGTLEFRGYQVRDEAGRWVRHGPWEAWHANGTLHEVGAYEDDEEIGVWQWFHENGARMATGEMVDGKRIGSWTYWHDNGNVWMNATYADGVANGPWTNYHEDGSLAAQGAFAGGELDGPWTVWTEDGAVDPDGTGTYVAGEKVDGQ